MIAIDYRGFGDSTGTPFEQGLIADARAVWDYVDSLQSSKGDKVKEGEGEGEGVILIGQSLGTGVVSGLAGQLAQEGISPFSFSSSDSHFHYAFFTMLPLWFGRSDQELIHKGYILELSS